MSCSELEFRVRRVGPLCWKQSCTNVVEPKPQSHTPCFQDSRSSQSPPVLGPGCTSNETKRSPDTIPKTDLVSGFRPLTGPMLSSGLAEWFDENESHAMAFSHLISCQTKHLKEILVLNRILHHHQKKRVSFGRMLIILPVEFSQL